MKNLHLILTSLLTLVAFVSLGVTILVWRDVQYIKPTHTLPLTTIDNKFTYRDTSPYMGPYDPRIVVLKSQRSQAALRQNANTQQLARIKADKKQDTCLTLAQTNHQVAPYKNHLVVHKGRIHNLPLFPGVQTSFTTQGKNTVITQSFNGVKMDATLFNTTRQDARKILAMCLTQA